MKKKMMVIIFRIICIFILIAAIFLIIFFNINRIKGKIFVTVNGKEYLLDSLKCKYVGQEKDEKVIYKSKSSGLFFKNRGSLHGMYEYSFAINNEEIDISPKILVFKTNWWKIWNMDVNIDVYKEDEIWNADISADVNGYTYQKTFYDVENNVIEYRVE